MWLDSQDLNINFNPIATMYSVNSKLQGGKSSNHAIGEGIV